jgi:hypothetical protein
MLRASEIKTVTNEGSPSTELRINKIDNNQE